MTEQEKAQKKAYRETHREGIADAWQRWYAANRAKRLIYHRAYAKAKPGWASARGRAWRERLTANPEAYEATLLASAERTRAWRVANPGRYAEWLKANPELDHVRHTRRRARKVGAKGEATVEQTVARWDYYGGLCWMCGIPATCTDHVKPLTKGGSNWPSNLRPACGSCNARKGSRWPYPLALLGHLR